MWFAPPMFFGLLWTGLGGCVSVTADSGRQSWLLEAFYEDNRIWLSRDQSLLTTKFQRMEAGLYNYMRGTAAISLQDWTRITPDRQPTAFLTDPRLGEVLLMGDPHPENIGSFLWPDGSVVLDFNDFDGAVFGPYLLDVRRGALGLGVLMSLMEGCEQACREQGIRGLVMGYCEGATGGTSGDWASELAQGGALVDLLLDKVAEEGPEKERLYKYTTSGQIDRDEGLDEEGEGVLDLSLEEQAQFERIWPAAMAQLPEGVRVLDVARRYGSGVASLPAVRYFVLIDRGDEALGDEDLLYVREVGLPPMAVGLQTGIPGLFNDNAHRIREAPRRLWEREDADPMNAAVLDENQTFKVLTYSSFYNGYDHEDLVEAWEEGEADVSDMAGLGRVIGLRLARAHRQQGEEVAAALVGELSGRCEAFEDERWAEAEQDLQIVVSDYNWFLSALSQHGPLLGMDLLEQGQP